MTGLALLKPWSWGLEDESLIYSTLDYVLHIVEYVVFPILDLREMLWFALNSNKMIPFADVLVVCWWGVKQLGHG